MLKRLALAFACLVLAPPALALEPERREVIVTHNRVWDGYVYKENFVPSDIDEMVLLSDVDNAVSFVRTQEYYWPLSRQSYVALEKQREEIGGTLIVRRDGEITAEIPRQDHAILYPEGAVNGQGRLLWGDEAHEAYETYKQEEEAFIRELAAARKAQTAYERALKEAAAARIAGKGVQEVPPPPKRPEPFLKLVTEPRAAYRVALPPGEYSAALFQDSKEVPGTRTAFSIIRHANTDVLTFDIVPEERWTRPIQANTEEDRIYVRPGARFFVTLHEASRFKAADYMRLVQPQAIAPEGRRIWVRRKPAEAAAMHVQWDKAASESLALTDLKVVQTQGSSFGYVVRPARENEMSDLAAFTIEVPEEATASGRMIVPSGAVTREIVVVQPRRAEPVWLLATLPAVLGAAMSWWRWRRRD